jgi:hypothetical protein
VGTSSNNSLVWDLAKMFFYRFSQGLVRHGNKYLYFPIFLSTLLMRLPWESVFPNQELKLGLSKLINSMNRFCASLFLRQTRQIQAKLYTVYNNTVAPKQ